MSTETDRSYEVYQRQTEADIPVVIPPGFALSAGFVADPHPTLKLLRQHYPCYRDWYTNSFWVTRYDDVTSVIADHASFEIRPRRSWYGDSLGGDLSGEPGARDAIGRAMIDHAESLAAEAVREFEASDGDDLIGGYVMPYFERVLAAVVGVPQVDAKHFGDLLRTAQAGTGWHAGREDLGRRAMSALARSCAEALAQRRTDSGEDLLSAVLAGREDVSDDNLADDVVATLVELSLETLEGSLANLLCLLLSDTEQLQMVHEDPELVRRAWQETMRHSPPVAELNLYTTREVERFGRLIPLGSLVVCSAIAANRDPQIFAEPDRFWIERTDLAYREARGQFRTDGLASAVAPGLLPLSKLPAVPADRPPSFSALTEHCVTVAAQALLTSLDGLRTPESDVSTISARWPGDVRKCRRLIVEWEGRRG